MSIIKTATIDLTGQIPSVNNTYVCKATIGGKSWRYKDKRVQTFQDEVILKLRQTEIAQLANIDPKTVDYFNLSIKFHIIKKMWVRDVTNMVKAVEDAIVHVTNIDDKLTRKASFEKCLSTSDCERMTVTLEVFLKGEVNENDIASDAAI